MSQKKSLASASAKAPLVADGAAGGSNDPMPAPPKPGVPESAPLPDPPEPLTKKRKVSLSSLVGGNRQDQEGGGRHAADGV